VKGRLRAVYVVIPNHASRTPQGDITRVIISRLCPLTDKGHMVTSSVSPLLVARPGRTCGNWQALLRTMPDIGLVEQASDESEAPALISHWPPSLGVMTTTLAARAGKGA